MHRPTYLLTIGSTPSAVIGGFIYRLVGNQIADYERDAILQDWRGEARRLIVQCGVGLLA
jgi:hypothetical protein